MSSPDPYERIAQAVESLDRDRRAWLIDLLRGHAYGTLAAGILTALDGTAGVFEAHSPGWRWIAAGVAIAASMVLLYGIGRTSRTAATARRGLLMLMVWDLAMGSGFFIAAASTDSPTYPVAIYGTLVYLTAVHYRRLGELRAVR